ncbi:type II toxin-antitoxin system ParD family antitoxin [bacterium]|jgi:antitoxin ParD1/3/4|nr:type II toxin-antitoxin system ParD family antitoxin [bacterium]
MATLNISLPDNMKRYVSTQVTVGDYGSDSEYIRALIRKDKVENERQLVELKILEGFQGEGRILTESNWATIQEKATARLNKSTK